MWKSKGGGDEDEGRWGEVLYNVDNDLCIVYQAVFKESLTMSKGQFFFTFFLFFFAQFEFLSFVKV